MKVYLINFELNTGFFSEIIHILGHLILADKKNLLPIRKISKKNKFYHNIWTDFFQDFNNDNWNSSIKPFIVGKQKDALIELPHGIYAWKQKNINIIKHITGKYCKFNEQFTQKISKIKSAILEKVDDDAKILGVHARGTDLKFLGNKNIQTNLNFQSNDINMIHNIFTNKNYDYIYLATDDYDILTLFKQKFNNKCLYNPEVIRYQINPNSILAFKDEKNVFTGNYSYIKKPWQTNKHKFREIRMKIYNNETNTLISEALADAYMLSNCDAIVCGLSGLSNFAIFISSSISNYYCYQQLRN